MVSPGKRRTPGLRREEVAVLAGIGTSWYSWLEQGRDINVSESVARSIVRALRLSRPETRYLYQLLGINPPLGASAVDGGAELDLTQIVDEWLPNPALIIDNLWNLLCCNRAAAHVFGISSTDRNLLVSFFTKSEVRSRYVDPHGTARLAVAQFRTDAVAHYDDPILNNLVTSLCEQSEEFATLWHKHEVLEGRLKNKEVEHPDVGRLSFVTQSWQLDGPHPVRLFLHVPNRVSDTRRKLETLLKHDSPITRARTSA